MRKPQNEIVVLLQQCILTSVAAIGGGIVQMLRAIHFDRHPYVRAKQVQYPNIRRIMDAYKSHGFKVIFRNYHDPGFAAAYKKGR